MSFAAIGASIAGAAVAAGLSAALAPGAPGTPNLARSSRRAVLADLRTLPGRRQVETLARLGREGDYETGGQVAVYRDPNGHEVRFGPGERPGLVQAGILGHPIRYEPATTHVDFRGLGDADVAGQLARGMAQNQLELSRRYGPEFVAEARRQQEQADPEGTAARALLASEVNRIARTPRERPVQGKLDSLMAEQLAAGRDITPDTAEMVDAVRRRRAESGDAPGVDLATELNQGPAGEMRRAGRLSRAMAYLSSGATSQDTGYRDEQQNLANMANFLGGRTPESQFATNRNAQTGATPVAQAAPLPGQNPNAIGQGLAGDAQAFQQGVSAQTNQVSPWFAGLNTLLQGARGAGAAGFRPFA